MRMTSLRLWRSRAGITSELSHCSEASRFSLILYPFEVFRVVDDDGAGPVLSVL